MHQSLLLSSDTSISFTLYTRPTEAIPFHSHPCPTLPPTTPFRRSPRDLQEMSSITQTVKETGFLHIPACFRPGTGFTHFAEVSTLIFFSPHDTPIPFWSHDLFACSYSLVISSAAFLFYCDLFSLFSHLSWPTNPFLPLDYIWFIVIVDG